MKVSVIIPVFNEVESIKELYDQLKIGLEQFTPNEIIFVDDGSSDGSVEAIKKISEFDDSVIFIQFHRNYGKSSALSEGFKYANGNYVVTMDADLQDDPSEIKNLINKLEEGYDLVSGWKKDRKDPLSKRLPPKLFNFVTRVVTGVRIHDFNCGLKIYKKAIVKTLELYGGRHRYIPAMAGQKKFKVTEIIVNHRPRIYGETKYGGPAPPDGRHTYVFKAYALDTLLDLKEGYSKQELEDKMKGHILAEAKLTGTFAP